MRGWEIAGFVVLLCVLVLPWFVLAFYIAGDHENRAPYAMRERNRRDRR